MRKPDFIGKFGRAWSLPMDNRETPAHYAANYSALIHCPASHMIWPWHLLGVVSLCDIVGTRPAHKLYPEAEWEIGVYAINPEVHPNPDPKDGRWDLLEPLDLREQFHGVNARQARAIGELAASSCVKGYLVPDSDYRSHWKVSIAETVKHMIEGLHSDDPDSGEFHRHR